MTQAVAEPFGAIRPATLVARTVLALHWRDIAWAWDSLFRRADSALPYLARAWVESFVVGERARGVTLAVTVWHGDVLVALLPLAVRESMGLLLGVPVGTGVPSYLGLLLDPAHGEAVRVLAHHCVAQHLFDILYTEDSSTAHAPTQMLWAAFEEAGLTERRALRNVCWRIRLGCKFDVYLSSQTSSKRRAKLRREARLLEGAGAVVIERYIGAEVTEKTLNRVVQIQQESWMKRRGAAVLGHSFHRQLLRNMAGAGMLHVWLLTRAGEDAAFVIGFVAQEQLLYSYTAFKLRFERLSVGKVLTARVIRDACDDGLNWLDFGHGDAEYKRFWSNESHRVERVFVGRGWRGALVARGSAWAWRLAKHPWLREPLRWVYRSVWLRCFRRAPVNHDVATVDDSVTNPPG